jgi:hypothetical protein
VEMPLKPLFKKRCNVIEKQKHLFLVQVILAIAIQRVFMASYGPGENSITQKLYSFQNGKQKFTRGTR